MGNKVGLGEIVDAKINESKQICSLGKLCYILSFR